MREFEVGVRGANPVRLAAYAGPMPGPEFRRAFFDWLEEHPLRR